MSRDRLPDAVSVAGLEVPRHGGRREYLAGWIDGGVSYRCRVVPSCLGTGEFAWLAQWSAEDLGASDDVTRYGSSPQAACDRLAARLLQVATGAGVR